MEENTKVIRVDPTFIKEILEEPGGDFIKYCLQCGACTATCPVSRFSKEYRPRRIIEACIVGYREMVFQSDEIWMCAACYSCTERCPQDVFPTDIIRVLRNVAVKKGHIPKPFADVTKDIIKLGRIGELLDFQEFEREELGLTPEQNWSKDAASKIAERTGLKAKMEGLE